MRNRGRSKGAVPYWCLELKEIELFGKKVQVLMKKEKANDVHR